MQAEERNVHLVIADISGFTRFIWAHRESVAHAQVLVNDLLGALLERIEPPVEVAKLEGDAVFFYAGASDPAEEARLAETVQGLFEAFRIRQQALCDGNLCACHACSRLDVLRLKIIVHYGSALFHSVGRFRELAGPEVITVHRLTKNSVDADEYLLVTASAFQRLTFPTEMRFDRIAERYPDIGAVSAFLHLPNGSRAPERRADASFAYRFGKEWVKYFRSLPYRFGMKRVTLRPPDELPAE
jgi:class 3 adenylate cyclase